MANGAFKFKDNSGNVVSFISGSGSNISFSGGTLDLSGMTGLTLGNLTLSGTTQNALSASHAASYLLTSSFNTYSGTTDTLIGTLQTSTGSLNSFTSSATTRLNSIESTTGSLNSYTSSNTTNVNSIHTSTGSLNTFTSSATTRLNSIEGVSGSYATTGSNQFKNDQVITGSLTVTGFIDAQELRTTYISSSILYRSGSTKFGDELSDTHSFTGSLYVTGGVQFNTQQNFIVSSSGQGWVAQFVNGSSNPSYIGIDINGVYFQPTVKGTTIYDGGATKYLHVTSSGIGINKFTPNATLDVNGNTIVSGSLTTTNTANAPMFILENNISSSYSQIQFKGETKHAYIFKGNSTYTSYGGTNALNFYTDPGSGAGGFAFHPQGTVNAVFIDNAGNLGVGVGNAPTAKLDIAGGNAIIANNNNGPSYLNIRNNSVGTAAYSALQLGNDGSNNRGGISITSSGWATSGVIYASGLYLYTNGAGGVTISAEGATGSINFATNSNLKGRMNNSGYLGLNEPTPTNLLHLAGASATPSLRLASTSTGYYWDIGRENATTGDFIFNYKTPSTTSTEWVRITTLGNVGIGVSPSEKLTIYGAVIRLEGAAGVSPFGIANNNSSGFRIYDYTAGVNKLLIAPGAAGLITITGELTLTGSSTHMNIISDTNYAYTRYQGGANDLYLIQNLPTLTSNNVGAGAAYFYMANSQNFEFSWAGTSKIIFTSGGSGTFVGGVTSDRRTKENISLITDNTLSFINELKPVSYQFISDKTKKTRRGFIAQDVLETSIPSLVLGNGELEDGTYGLDYDGILSLAVKAIQEQQQIISDLKDRITILENN